MRNVVSLLALLFVTACTIEPEIETSSEERKLVANGLFTEAGEWKVELSISEPYLSRTPFQHIGSASVNILEQDQPLIELTYAGDGIYTGQSNVLSPGKKYTIRAAAGGKTIMASDHLPAAIQIDDINIQSDQTITDNIGTAYHAQTTVAFSIRDNAGEKNNYHIFVTGSSGSTVQFRSNSPLLDNLDHRQGFLISDKKLQGQSIDFMVYFSRFGTESMKVHVRNISENYYQYILSASLSIEGSIDQQAFPVKRFSNIENGYGLFAGYSEQVIEVE